MLAAGLSGCLVAPPIEREESVNHPFTINPAGLIPSPQATHAISLQLGQTQQFFAIDAVSDPDGDDVFIFWLVRDPTNDEILDDRPLPSYTFDPCDRRFGRDGDALPPQVFLEVLASDRATLIRSSPPGADAIDEADVQAVDDCPGGAVGPYCFPDAANVATIGWWWITIAAGGTCP